MLPRIFGLVFLFALMSAAAAQVTAPDQSLQQQLIPESFKLQASAVATKENWDWKTAVSYTLKNNSGMNLYMGIMMGSISLGTCTQTQAARGGFQLLPGPGVIAYPIDIRVGPPHAAYVPAGARIAGTIILDDCSAPNPGQPTVPLSITLMVGKSAKWKTMIQYPVSADAPIQQMQ